MITEKLIGEFLTLHINKSNISARIQEQNKRYSDIKNSLRGDTHSSMIERLETSKGLLNNLLQNEKESNDRFNAIASELFTFFMENPEITSIKHKMSQHNMTFEIKPNSQSTEKIQISNVV